MSWIWEWPKTIALPKLRPCSTPSPGLQQQIEAFWYRVPDVLPQWDTNSTERLLAKLHRLALAIFAPSTCSSQERLDLASRVGQSPLPRSLKKTIFGRSKQAAASLVQAVADWTLSSSGFRDSPISETIQHHRQRAEATIPPRSPLVTLHC